MKTTIKKIIPLLLMTGTLVGCTAYSSKPGPIKNLVGLYELEIIKKKNDPDDKDTYDYKSTINAKAYFTVNKDGYGYYGYKDKNTKARVDQVFSTINLDVNNKDHPEWVRSITLYDGNADVETPKKEVGCLDEPTLGFHDTLFKKYLEYTIPFYKGQYINKKYEQKYQYVLYKRIGTETSLAKINQLMGTNVSFKRLYEMKRMTRFMVYSCKNNYPLEQESKRFGIYDYAFLDVDSYKNGTVKLYYKITGEDEGQKVDATVSVFEKGYSVKVHAFEKDFINYRSGKKLSDNLPVSYNYDLEVDRFVDESFGTYSGEATTPEELIAELTASV